MTSALLYSDNMFKTFLGKELIFVGLLILSIVLIYAVLSFAFMYNFFNPDDNLYCDTLWECYVTVMREGLLGTFRTVSILYLIGYFQLIQIHYITLS